MSPDPGTGTCEFVLQNRNAHVIETDKSRASCGRVSRLITSLYRINHITRNIVTNQKKETYDTSYKTSIFAWEFS